MVRELDEKIGWEIQSKKLYSGTPGHALDKYSNLVETIDYKEVPGYKAISRDDNGGILSVMKNSYSPMTNAEFMDTVFKIQEISGFKLAGFNEFKGGRKVLGFLENDKEDLRIGQHKIKDYMLLGNSFDGTTSFFQGTSTVLIRCQNQFSQIQVQNKIRHTKSIGRKLEEFYAYLDFYINQRNKLFENFERFGNVTLTEELREQLIKFVLDVKEVTDKELSARKQNQIDLLRATILGEVKELGDNMWGAFNGVTKYTTHELVSKDPVFGNVFGQQANINDRAISFVTTQLAFA